MNMNLKYLYRFSLCAVLLTMFGCAKDAVPESEDADVRFESSIQTKVSYFEESSSVKVNWVSDDLIGIYSLAGGESMVDNSPYLAEQDGGTSTFRCQQRALRVRWKDEQSVHDFYAYYPFSENVGNDFNSVLVNLPSEQTQNGADNMSHIVPLDFMWAAQKGYIKGDTPVNFQFHHLFSILDFEFVTDNKVIVEKVVFKVKDGSSSPLAFNGGRINLSNGELDLTAAEISSSVTVNCNFSTGINSPKHVYALINPGHQGKTIQVSVFIKGEERIICEKAVPDGGFPVGKMIHFKSNYNVKSEDVVEIKDLSEVETANCYVITSPSKAYKFRADVKGNGYVPSELNGIVTSTSISPKSVLVLWYNTVQSSNNWVDAVPVDMTSLVYEGGYIHFDTPEEFVDGNLVIAAFAEEGLTYDNITVDSNGYINNATLLWSWHIWAVKNMDLESEALTVNYTDGSGNVTPFVVMDRNLGALVNGKYLGADDKTGYGAAAALGNCYQWGRKDPFPHLPEYGNYWPLRYSSKLIATPTYTPVKALQRTPKEAVNSPSKQLFVMDYSKMGGASAPAISECLHKFENVTFAQSINSADAYPYKYFKGAGSQTYDKHWFYNNPEKDPWKYLWGDYDVNDGVAIRKTLYDPCPAGWTLWQEETINAFVQEGAATASIAPNTHGLMVAGSYFGYNGGGRREDMSFEYATPVVICGYGCPIALTSGTASDRYNHKILRSVEWTSPSDKEGSKISVVQSDLNTSNPKPAVGYSVRCIKTK